MGVKEKKTDITEIAIYTAAITAVLILCTWVGYVLEMTASPQKGVQIMEALNSVGDYANPISFIRSFGMVFTDRKSVV